MSLSCHAFNKIYKHLIKTEVKRLKQASIQAKKIQLSQVTHKETKTQGHRYI